MIITRKRFRKEVTRKARELYQAKMTSLVQEAHSRELLRMNRRIDELEKELKKPRGSINGFYATPTETTIVRKEGEHNDAE